MDTKRTLHTNVQVIDYDPNWANIYQLERDALVKLVEGSFVELEHLGSTAVPGLRAKPVIDMMAALVSLDEFEPLLSILSEYGYEVFDVGMTERFFLRRVSEQGQVFHLHIVALDSWSSRKERLMRDYLLRHPDDVQAYGDLKTRLATEYADDSAAYTKAKTEFIQSLMNKVMDSLGLPHFDVWTNDSAD